MADPRPQRASNPPLRPLEVRRGEIARVEALAGGIFKVSYSFLCSGAGEGSVDVNFPVAFYERPHCSQGGSLADGSTVEDGNYPWCAAMGADWVTEVRGGATYYVGCTVILVLAGKTGQEAWIDFGAEGKALQAPLPTA